MNEVQKAHDHFFREVFSRPELAHAFLEANLPPDIVAELDMDTLEPVPGSLVDNELQEHLSDLLYRIQRKDGRELFAYTLIEHKSQTYQWVMLQLLRYMLQQWIQDTNNGLPLRPIIPIVVHHGESTWKIPRTFLPGNCPMNSAAFCEP